MILLNHNVKIGSDIYHIQTEKRGYGDTIVFAETDIFFNGTVVWTYKKDLSDKIDNIEKQDFITSHREGLLYLKWLSNNKKERFLIHQKVNNKKSLINKIDNISEMFIKINKPALESLEIFSTITKEKYYSHIKDPKHLKLFDDGYILLLKKAYKESPGEKFYTISLDFLDSVITLGTIPETELVYGIVINTHLAQGKIVAKYLQNKLFDLISDICKNF